MTRINYLHTSKRRSEGACVCVSYESKRPSLWECVFVRACVTHVCSCVCFNEVYEHQQVYSKMPQQRAHTACSLGGGSACYHCKSTSIRRMQICVCADTHTQTQLLQGHITQTSTHMHTNTCWHTRKLSLLGTQTGGEWGIERKRERWRGGMWCQEINLSSCQAS